MRWVIYGADAKTGRELSVVVEAEDPKSAADWMYYNDILVSSVAELAGNTLPMSASESPRPVHVPHTREAPPPMDYHAEDRPPDHRPPLAAAPVYPDVLRGARWLHAIAVFAEVLACLLIVVGLGSVAISFVDEWRRRVVPHVPQVADIVWLAGGCVLLGVAIFLFVCASMTSMMSGLALAVRDVARNSFEQRPRVAMPEEEAPEDVAVKELRMPFPARGRVAELLPPSAPSERRLLTRD